MLAKQPLKSGLELLGMIGVFLISFFVYRWIAQQPVEQTYAQTTQVSWYMAGANPQRTSWVAEQVPPGGGTLYPQWFKPIEPYIPHNFQIVAGNDMIFVSTARGLYALDLDGNLKWVYPTEMPLGQSPTYVETSFSAYPKRLYIPGTDHKIHCIDANPDVNSLPSVTIPQTNNTAQKINNHSCWKYEAKADGIGAAFMTNPLALNVGGNWNIYVGNRDGYMYALRDNGNSASLLWTQKTDGPIMFSAAASYPNSNGQYDNNTKIYFASNDSYAYSVSAVSGSLAWKSGKLPGAGFFAYWPVVYKHSDGKEYVLLSGSHNYREGIPPRNVWANLESIEREIFLGEGSYDAGGTTGTIIGINSGGWTDTSQKAANAAMSVASYFQNKPWRKTYFVLDSANGQEAYNAPFGWVGTQSGTRYPSLILPSDNNIYQTALYTHDSTYISDGAILRWRFGTPLVNKAANKNLAVDEPLYTAAGGNMIYFNWWGSLVAGASNTANGSEQIFWDHDHDCYSWAPPNCMFPGYEDAMDGVGGRAVNGVIPRNIPGVDIWYFGESGAYDRNGDGNPPIPYNGKVFFHNANAILVFGTTNKSTGTKLTTAWAVEKQDFPTHVTQFTPTVSESTLKQKLETEVQKMISLGHLYPGYMSSGMLDMRMPEICGDNFQDYFHNSAETLWVLSRAMPFLTSSTQTSLRSYLTSEYTNYNPTSYYHIGFAQGASRSHFDLPPEEENRRSNYSKGSISQHFTGWNGTPYVFYGLWQYAKAQNMTAAQAKAIFDPIANSVDTSLPADSVMQYYPFIPNAYLSGYYGYMQLQKMAGYSESTSVRSAYTNLFSKRINLFDKDRPSGDPVYGYEYGACNAFNASRNFMYLAPEVAKELAANSTFRAKIQDAINGVRVVNVYNRDVAYWFISWFDDTASEGIHQPLYDQVMFQAKAYILGDNREELLKYLDAPAFKTGDLFHINNLVTALEAPSNGTPVPTPSPSRLAGDVNGDHEVNGVDLKQLLNSFLSLTSTTLDLDNSGKVNLMDAAWVVKQFGLTW